MTNNGTMEPGLLRALVTRHSNDGCRQGAVLPSVPPAAGMMAVSRVPAWHGRRWCFVHITFVSSPPQPHIAFVGILPYLYITLVGPLAVHWCDQRAITRLQCADREAKVGEQRRTATACVDVPATEVWGNNREFIGSMDVPATEVRATTVDSERPDKSDVQVWQYADKGNVRLWCTTAVHAKRARVTPPSAGNGRDRWEHGTLTAPIIAVPCHKGAQ
ncbi:hypothetical protein B0H17DRAFT_1138359 [Mycena rosella]|uniref:Uncharacterized protein n=1 Tax=Mycena rosella TaxID=1033263 RepID=A0AAD7D6K0_MYCRO|nr:hypothetical protein B0H17DRAFT_1138359 [Mycena rosella]